MPFRAVEEAGKLLVRAEALVAEAKRKEAARRAAERELNDSLPGFFTKADPERLRAVRAEHPALNDLPRPLHPWLTIARVAETGHRRGTTRRSGGGDCVGRGGEALSGKSIVSTYYVIW